MRSRLLVLAAILVGGVAVGAETSAADPRVQMWFHWVNDAVETAALDRDLAAMRDFGVSRAHIFYVKQGTGGVPTTETASDDWFEKMRFAFARAREYGVACSFHNGPGWAGSGGPWIEPEYAAKEVTSSETDADFPAADDVPLVEPWTVSNYYHEVAAFAFRRPDDPAPLPGDFDPKAFTVECSAANPNARVVLEYPTAFAPRALGFRVRVPMHLYLRVVASAETADGKLVELGRLNTYGWHMSGQLPYVIRFAKDRVIAAKRFFVSFERTARAGHWAARLVPDRFEVTDLEFTTLSRPEKLCAKAAMANQYGFFDGEDDAALATNDFIDVSSALREGRLAKDALPSGRWRILRLGYTITGKTNVPAMPGGRGLDCEKLSPRGLDRHWQQFVKRLLDLPEAKEVVKSVVIDSWDCDGQNWTEEMLAEFRRRRGYDLKPYLPVLAGYNVISDRVTSRVLFDFARTISDLYGENYFGRFAALCRAAGVESVVEPYAGPFDSYRAAREVTVPTSEFWLGDKSFSSRLKFVSSIAHVNGRPLVAAESFTSGGAAARWCTTPAELKEQGDWAWAHGINRLVVHSYVHQPDSVGVPGLSLGVHGTQLNRHTTWWREGIAWSRYVEEGQRFLSEGAPCAQLLVLAGESAPNATGMTEELSEAGYDYDFCGPDDLARVTVREGRLVFPSGASYDALWLGNDRALSSALLTEVERLVRAGARVAGARPHTTPSNADDLADWQRQVERLWTRGGIAAVSGARTAARALGLKPAVTCSVPGVRHLRRALSDGTLLLYIYNPGTAAEATLVTEKGEFIRPLEHGANFLRLTAESPKVVPAREYEEVKALTGPWTLTFAGTDVSAAPLMLTNLVSWSALPSPLCYHAGRATYRTTFNLTSVPQSLRLDLGDVRDVATVILNGERLKTLWYAPYVCEIATFARPGVNELELEVVNCWPNRLIGDARARAHFSEAPKDTGTKTSFDAWRATDVLLPAGLLGPVRLENSGILSRDAP